MSNVLFLTEDGVPMTADEVKDDLEASIAELMDRLEEAKTFRKKLREGTFNPDKDQYLSFGAPVQHGYDQTSPSFIVVTTDGEKK